MGYYDYHAVNKQRIMAGELVDYYFTENYPRIGEALVLVFNAPPFRRPIRPYRWPDYVDLLVDWRRDHAESHLDPCPA